MTGDKVTNGVFKLVDLVDDVTLKLLIYYIYYNIYNILIINYRFVRHFDFAFVTLSPVTYLLDDGS